MPHDLLNESLIINSKLFLKNYLTSLNKIYILLFF